jgi:hypothetical protein
MDTKMEVVNSWYQSDAAKLTYCQVYGGTRDEMTGSSSDV